MNISLLTERAKYFETYISKLTSQEHQQARLAEAMNYSLFAGGKRLRPVLCMTCAKLCGLDIAQVMNFATAIEMIHTYSLIHDDLPCMDNDDLRRGKPTCHKVYGEAMALLAGDALLTDAVSQMLKTQLDPSLVLVAIQEIMLASGSKGMVSGQAMDMDFSGHTKNFSSQSSIVYDDLIKMHSLKTGALLRASCTSGAILAGANKKQIASLNDFGLAFGLAFQITDDILDIIGVSNELGKNVGSDNANEKASYPNILGLDKSIDLAKKSVKKAQASLEDFKGEDADFLRDLTEYLLTRKS